MGSFLLMGLIGLILIGLVNIIFLHSEGVEIMISFVGIALFVGITAYDVQKIKKLAAANAGFDSTTIALWGAMNLYLDFINIFLKLLRILGKARR